MQFYVILRNQIIIQCIFNIVLHNHRHFCHNSRQFFHNSTKLNSTQFHHHFTQFNIVSRNTNTILRNSAKLRHNSILNFTYNFIQSHIIILRNSVTISVTQLYETLHNSKSNTIPPNSSSTARKSTQFYHNLTQFHDN